MEERSELSPEKLDPAGRDIHPNPGKRRASTTRFVGHVIVSVIGAAVVEGLFALITNVFPGPDGLYGAPLPVGTSSGLAILASFGFSGQPSTFNGLLFTADVLVMALLLFAVLLWDGIGSGVAAVVGGILSQLLIAIMYVQFLQHALPFAGFPLPVAIKPSQSPNLLVFWVDVILFTFLFAAAWHLFRRVVRPQVRPRSSSDGSSQHLSVLLA